MSLRISQIAIQPIFLDEHDAPQKLEPAVFQGDAERSALEKAQQFLEELPAQLAEQATATETADE